MGDSVAQKKKLNKNKLKKTIKNVLCRPDHIQWPEVSEDNKLSFEEALAKHKLILPNFKKQHWKELKLIPKDKRPKPPKQEKVNGLLFGITECCNAVENKQCSAIVIESMVNPRVIVQPVIEACKRSQVPFICCQNLRKTTEKYFGIPTSCLGIQLYSLPDLTKTILEIADNYAVTNKISPDPMEMMDVDLSTKDPDLSNVTSVIIDTVDKKCPYLYRTNKKTRVFVPDGTVVHVQVSKDFIGQNYIEFSDKSNPSPAERNTFKKMMVKRIANNPNRVKMK